MNTAIKKPGRRTREFWKKVIEEYESQGYSQVTIAKRHGVSLSGLHYWLRRLRARPNRKSVERVNVPLRLLEVKAADRIVPRQTVRVRLPDGLTIDFEQGAEPGYVAAMVRAVQGE